MKQGATKSLLIAAGFLLALTSCQSKEEISATPEISEAAVGTEDIGKQFRGLAGFKHRDYAAAFKLIDDETDVRPYTQQLAIVGRDPKQYFGSKLKPPRLCEFDIMEQLHDDPITKITALAREHRIVIINEAHDQARDRAFISKVAAALRPEGYTIYAAETFTIRNLTQDEWQAEIMARGFPINNDGYYSNEPVFGQLVQTVLDLGYTPVAYETRLPYDKTMTSEQQVASRETQQMKNLVEHAVNKFPNQKILVHVGYSHALETLSSQGNSWFAHRLKLETGLDPLTIFQTKTKRSCIIYGDDVKSALDYKYYMPDPDNKDADISYGGYDMQLYPGETGFTKGRPNWLADMGRKFVDINAHLNIAGKWVVVEARSVDEPAIDSANEQYGKGARPIPHDRVLVRPGEDIALALVPGGYNVTAYGVGKTIIDSAKITVK